MMITQFVVFLGLLSSMSNAFVVPRSGIVTQQYNSFGPLLMASTEEEAERLREQAAKLRAEAAELSGAPETEEKEVAVPTSGTFYDDEVRSPFSYFLSFSSNQRFFLIISNHSFSQTDVSSMLCDFSISSKGATHTQRSTLRFHETTTYE